MEKYCRCMSLPRNLLERVEKAAGYELRRNASRHRVRLFQAKGVDLVLDVGAAVGDYGRQLRRAGYQGAIVSFEPLTEPFAALLSATTSDPQWTARNVALGAQVGKAEINVARNSDSSSLLPMLDRHLKAAPHTAYVGTETIQVSTLDTEWTAMPPARNPFLKIDTQGFEGQVLDGAANILERLAGVQLELSFVPLYDGGLLYDEAILRMRDAAFVPMGIEPGFRDDATSQLLQADVVFFRV
jgi:FkbM family methyltransferase